MKLSDEAKHVVASNLAVAAALLQVANATKGKSTTSDGGSEAFTLFRNMLTRLERELP